MKDEHILDILDDDLQAINSPEAQAHAATCEGCRQAIDAARISSALFRAQPDGTFAPSPFFQTKVLNALRERQTLRKPIAAFWRWWQASAMLVAVMLMIVVSLIALTIFAPATGANESSVGINDNPYSAEAVLLNQKSRNNLTTEQTLEIIYDTKK